MRILAARERRPGVHATGLPIPPRLAWLLLAITAFAAALRLWGLEGQVVQDDEWHAIRMLMQADAATILGHFGYADHSIPLTLFYDWMASRFGLAEGRMRAVQALCGIALVPAVGLLAWRITRDGAVAALTAIFVAGAPFLVLYSRFARPYAITLLLTVAAASLLWKWHRERQRRDLAGATLAAALAAWLHPIAGLFPATACVVLLVMAACDADAAVRRRRCVEAFAAGAIVAVAMLLPLAWPLANDWRSLFAKAIGDRPTAFTIERMLSVFFGGMPGPIVALLTAAAVAGAALFTRRSRALGTYLVALAVLPPIVVAAAGAQWSHQGHTFGRYVLPLQLLLFFFASFAIVEAVRRLAPRGAFAGVAVAVLAAGYALLTPTIRQVATLGPWYGHLLYHYDYGDAHNRAIAYFDQYSPPAFEVALGREPAGSLLLIEAPFNYDASYDPFPRYAEFHHQRVKLGMLGAICPHGDPYGEPREGDRRFRFSEFVFLDNVADVRKTGARYVLLHDDAYFFPKLDFARCREGLARYYGPPVAEEPGLAVFAVAPTAAR